MKEIPLTVILPQPTHDALERLSKVQGTSKRWEARKIVIAGVKKPQKANA